MGLLVSSQPDALVVCHIVGREHILGWPDYPNNDIEAIVEHDIQIGLFTNPNINCVGASVYTIGMSAPERADYLGALSERPSLPCVNPLEDGTQPIVENIVKESG